VEIHGGFHDGQYNTVRTGNLFVELRRGYAKVNADLDGLQVQVLGDALDAVVENLNVQLVPPGSRVRLRTLNTDAHYIFDFDLAGGHTLTAGAAVIVNRAESEDIIAGTETQTRPAAYVQDEWKLAEPLFLTTGVRLDYHPESGLLVNPQASLVLSPSEAHTARATVRTGFRNPSFVESYVSLLSQPFPSSAVPFPFTQVQIQFLPSDDLDSERMLSYQVGYSGRWFGWLKPGFDVYYNRIDDIINTETISAAPVSLTTILETRRFQNTEDLRALGVEAYGEILLSDTLSLWGNGALQRVEEQGSGDRFLQAPREKANVGVRAGLPGLPLHLDVWANHFGKTEFGGDFAAELKARNTLNVRLGWKIGLVEVWGACTNTNDDRHREDPQGDEFGREFFLGFQVR
jgi:outer membrane receptor protein involved in Fe transport